jgi:cation transport regulator
MPYQTNEELPDSVKNVLPPHAQDIYRVAFNSAWEEYKNPEKRRRKELREQVVRKVAWAAVKAKYHKAGKQWEEN